MNNPLFLFYHVSALSIHTDLELQPEPSFILPCVSERWAPWTTFALMLCYLVSVSWLPFSVGENTHLRAEVTALVTPSRLSWQHLWRNAWRWGLLRVMASCCWEPEVFCRHSPLITYHWLSNLNGFSRAHESGWRKHLAMAFLIRLGRIACRKDKTTEARWWVCGPKVKASRHKQSKYLFSFFCGMAGWPGPNCAALRRHSLHMLIPRIKPPWHAGLWACVPGVVRCRSRLHILIWWGSWWQSRQHCSADWLLNLSQSYFEQWPCIVETAKILEASAGWSHERHLLWASSSPHCHCHVHVHAWLRSAFWTLLQIKAHLSLSCSPTWSQHVWKIGCVCKTHTIVIRFQKWQEFYATPLHHMFPIRVPFATDPIVLHMQSPGSLAQEGRPMSGQFFTQSSTTIHHKPFIPCLYVAYDRWMRLHGMLKGWVSEAWLHRHFHCPSWVIWKELIAQHLLEAEAQN